MNVARKIVQDYLPALVEDFGNPADRRPRPKGVTPQQFNRATADAKARMASGEWDGARPLLFVALYAHLHEGVYGVPPIELTSTTKHQACLLAGMLLKREFDSDPARLAAFLRWSWQREQSTEKWRRENGRAGRRLHWKVQFGGSLVTDYRVDMARSRR